MKKIKMFRSSGLPVETEKLEDYKQEWKDTFDALNKKHGKDMLSLQEELAVVERELNDKYKTVIEVDFVKTKKAWESLLDEYGNVIVSRHRDTGELLYIIFDEDYASLS